MSLETPCLFFISWKKQYGLIFDFTNFVGRAGDRTQL